MDFLKRHYEKVILSVVLLGLAVVAALLPLRIQANQEKVERAKSGPPKGKSNYTPENLTTNLVLLQLAKDPPALDLGSWHYLFNPALWKRLPNKELVKIANPDQLGPKSLAILNITRLYLRLEFKGAEGTPDKRFYRVIITREGSPSKSQRSPLPKLVTLNSKVDNLFIAREVVGPEDDPAALVVFLADSNQRVVLEKDQEFKSPVGFAADLKYEPDGKQFLDKRARDEIEFAGKKYKIIAITESEVTVADPSGRPTTIQYKASSA
jgi:hypothetical protein